MRQPKEDPAPALAVGAGGGQQMQGTVEKNRPSAADDLEDQDEEHSGGAKYLLFHLGGEVQGVAITCVTEIIEMQKVTAVPGMPGYIKGVINLRNRVIPVMDLRVRFGMPAREYDDRTCTVIVRIGSVSLGLVVDTVAEVHEIAEGDVEPALAFGRSREQARFVSGLAKVGEKVVIVIDPDRLIAEEEVEAVRQAAGPTG
jgi:purine-binding chemotaxis protein CheW